MMKEVTEVPLWRLVSTMTLTATRYAKNSIEAVQQTPGKPPRMPSPTVV